MTPLEETIRAQRAAADPAVSAFVAANAGAGKTRVLTDRVARLLLAGVDPARILCITFTKAAAAEMSGRLFEQLGEWSLADDPTLEVKLGVLDGGAGGRDLGLARRLFARALETPGGLKIQTIHSFCEAVLKRFPLEAGVAPGFTVIEEAEALRLAARAIDRVAAQAGSNRTKPTGEAMARLAGGLGPKRLRDTLLAQIVSRQTLDAALDGVGGWDALLADTAAALGADPERDERDARAEIARAISPETMRRLQGALASGGKTAQGLAAGACAAFLKADDDDSRIAALSSLLLTKEGKPRSKALDNAAKVVDGGAEAIFLDAQQRFLAACEAHAAARAFADTRALHTLSRATLSDYDAMKAARAGLDYDDLVVRAGRLFFRRGSADWVLWKLDRGLEHILLDEAQDTSPLQWRAVEGPLAEFFAGAGARESARTFFAVGDQKQSIYSFQGADATLFKAKRIDLGKKIAAAARLVEEPLRLSFRTTAPVLSFVDALFADEAARDGLGEDDALAHRLRRLGEAGAVELWPLTPKRSAEEESLPWDAPLDAAPERNPVRDLTEAVARTIRRWLDAGEALESVGRPIAAGDIFVLVQSRSPLFHGIIRALSEAGVPVAGADRLMLLEDPAVEDFLSFAEAVLLSTDDLSLAETLKSPFFGFDDEDLFALSRDSEGSLWARLTRHGGERPHWAKAREEIARARRVAHREGPYAFLAHLLESGAPSGRKRLYARLGAASRETIDELLRQALDYEREHPRSLQGFLPWLRANAGEIRREIDQTSGAARVMTVHGAKGLEAPIVFLLDAHKGPNLTDLGPVFELDATPAPRGLFALSRGRGEDGPALLAARERAKLLQYQEYRRMLYVAATRARDRLYICGVESGNEKDPNARDTARKSWHALATDAFARLHGVVRAAHSEGWGDVLRIDCPQTAPVKKKDEVDRAPPALAPHFLSKAAPREEPPRRLAPSRLADEAEARNDAPSYSPMRPADAARRGRTLHRLLELLPSVAPAERRAGADRLLARLVPEIASAERARWREEVMAVIEAPAFAPVFAPGSRAEVRLAGALKGARAGTITGAIDRLAVEERRVMIVDYKTNRPPPQRIDEADPAYIRQLAAYRLLLQDIYPNRQIDCALLWTFEARLMPVPSALLDHASKSLFT